MTQILHIHPENPQARHIQSAVECIKKDGLIAYPTDSGYAFGWAIGNKRAQERVEQLRQTDKQHNFTVVCRDLSEIASYAQVDNSAYRLIKAHTPGPYTFILAATKQLPRRLHHPKRKSVGIRIPDHPVALALLEELGEAIMSSSLILPGIEMHTMDIDDLELQLAKQIDLFINSGYCLFEPTTVIDMMAEPPQVLRVGQGVVDFT